MTSRLKDIINTRFLHPTSTGIGNIPALDGIRGVAIMMVVGCHFFAFASPGRSGFRLEVLGFKLAPYLMHGSDGVRLFFVLSAFLLFLPYIRYHVYGGTKPSTVKFFERRALRIIPAFYFVMVLYLLLIAVAGMHPQTRELTARNVVINALFLQPFLMFVDNTTADFIPGTWSLAAEVHFYLVLPFIARYFTTMKRATLLAVLAVAACAVYRAMVHSMFGGNAAVALGYNIFAQFGHFALGMLAALIYFKKAAGEIRIPAWSSYVMIATGCILYWWKLHGGTRLVHDGELFAGFTFFLIVLGIVTGETFVRRILEWSPLRFIGLISYSMFLMNLTLVWYFLMPMESWLGMTRPLHRFGFNMAVGLPVLIALSTLTYLLVERPFLVRKAAGAERPSVNVTPPVGT